MEEVISQESKEDLNLLSRHLPDCHHRDPSQAAAPPGSREHYENGTHVEEFSPWHESLGGSDWKVQPGPAWRVQPGPAWRPVLPTSLQRLEVLCGG